MKSRPVAITAFHRAAGHHVRKVTNDAGAMSRFRIHVAGGKTFEVDVASAAINSNLGFRGYPVDANSPHKEFFFYAHGVNARCSVSSRRRSPCHSTKWA